MLQGDLNLRGFVAPGDRPVLLQDTLQVHPWMLDMKLPVSYGPEARQGTHLARMSLFCEFNDSALWKSLLCGRYSRGGCLLPGPSPTWMLAAEPPGMACGVSWE